MAVICNTCGLPDDLCACGDLDKDSTHIIIRLETRRFRKKGTMIEGLDPKINNLENVGRELKKKYACGGTAKEGYVFLQGDHRDTIKDTLVKLGFAEELTQTLIIQMMHGMGENGIDISEKAFVRDVALLIEFTKGCIYRSLELKHPTQTFFEQFVKLTVGPDNSIATEVDQELLEKYTDLFDDDDPEIP